eukprot:TRINITY_DN8121_c0_g1_i1.p1 TRINITY_DN8121_c0_g1~~TRINITY_DN8121_c0_g1_i1.p1  ORF type:complete len:174 (+),score=7.49 TRINITY_DN8121_c0_g1_i1:65-586(+)
MVFCTRACSASLILVATSIQETCSVSIAAAPVVAPGVAITSTVFGSAAAGWIAKESTEWFIDTADLLYWRVGPAAHIPSRFKPAFMALSALPVVVGADSIGLTWDCWKPMVRESSSVPSRGRLLTDLLNDPVISDYSLENSSVVVRNRWNESWRIDPVILPWGQVAGHAAQTV